MPRPGPRPYECVKRAWHSDRHQPIRGSIVQQIFRVAMETHSAVTKKNKEWQEKLPIVVLKAEEIMYSKANSEVEYTNPETLWDRVNDAINTIIRREETTETGELLAPCVEAALNLGCIQVRASRSQRHSNPRSYLTPRLQEPSPSPRILNKTSDERHTQLMPIHAGNQLNLPRNSTVNSTPFLSEPSSHCNQNSSFTTPQSYPSQSFALDNVTTGHDQFIPGDTKTTLNLGSVYPLYYGTDHHSIDQSHKPIYVGRAVSTSSVEPLKQNCFFYGSTENASARTSQVEAMKSQEKQRDAECDLSLRLGPLSHPYVGTERYLASETDDVGSSSYQEGKLCDMPSVSKEFVFFPGKTAYDPLKSNLRMLNSEDKGQITDATLRKRKTPFNGSDEDEQFCLQPEVPSNWLGHRFSGSGL